MKTKTVFIIAIAAGLLFTGCSKHNSAPAKPNCLINNISASGTSYVINYNADGKVNTISSSDGHLWNYTYTGNTVVINETSGGTFFYKYTIHLNNSGLPINFLVEGDQSGTDWLKYNYEYNGSALSKETITSSGGSNYTVNFTFDGSNIVQGDNGFSFGYYTDKPQQAGGYLSFKQLLAVSGSLDEFVFNCFMNKNLMKSFTDENGETMTFTYDFDADGKITSMTISNTRLVKYQYECK